MKFTMDVVGGKYNNAKKDNDFVYHDKVPALDSLPEVKGAVNYHIHISYICHAVGFFFIIIVLLMYANVDTST